MTCDQTQGLRPVLQRAQLWHVDHAWLVLLVFGQALVLVLILIARVGRQTT
jgi:hypothetical protein